MKLPKRVRFPGGFVVDVKVAARGSKHLDEDEFGCYLTDARDHGTIRLWEELTPRQQWRTLMHELIHALVDAQNNVDQQFGLK